MCIIMCVYCVDVCACVCVWVHVVIHSMLKGLVHKLYNTVQSALYNNSTLNISALHHINNSTLNICALHHVSLTGKANLAECCSDCLPHWIWVITDVEVKVGISPSGGALEVPQDFISLRVW